jgi:hypothetical protein
MKDLSNEWRWKVKGSKNAVRFTEVAIWYQKKASSNEGNVMLEKCPRMDNAQLDVIFYGFL